MAPRSVAAEVSCVHFAIPTEFVESDRMANALNWVPATLYNISISTYCTSVVSSYKLCSQSELLLPDNVVFDIYYELYIQGQLCVLATQYRKLDVFAKMLTVANKRHLLHHCFQALMDHGSRVSEALSRAYVQQCEATNLVDLKGSARGTEALAKLGLSLGGFLNDAGWFRDSEKVLNACLQMCKAVDDIPHLIKAVDCCIRLLHVRNANCAFGDAEVTYRDALGLVEKLKFECLRPNLAALYAEFSLLFFVKSYYDEAYHWSVMAMRELNSSLSVKVIIDVLRQTTKACVVKREFKRSELLIKQAVYLAREHFGSMHPKYSETLIDFGFFLLNVDCVANSVQVYQTALDIRMRTFGGNNIHVAIAHEDLAYASYVNEYSSGKFQDAQTHAEKAMDIMIQLLPEDHLLLASSKRVKALILEEVAIDSQDKSLERQQLLEALDLHLSALELAKMAFGERNVQTAKHYGNLGRLYQSMQRFEEAEYMHRKAIAIKEKLLGMEDYEVALSVGHLASLYNYDMNKFDQAKELYLRSVAIGKKLFGDGYSGLEYDYRGLIRVYNMLNDNSRVAEYNAIYHHWKQLRDSTDAKQVNPLQFDQRLMSIDEVVAKFLEMEQLSHGSR